MVLNPETPSYLFKEKDGDFIFATPTGYKQIEFALEKFDYDKALEKADRYSLKNAFVREFGEREDTSNKNTHKNR